jgi:hypothetical protein
MALIANTQYIFPPNWDGNVPETGGFKKVILHLTARCDDSDLNTDEADVIKLDISELRTTQGIEPVRTVIESLKWTVSGFNNVLLQWHRTPNETIATLAGKGEINHDLVDESDGEGDLTGNILLSSDGAQVGASYDIVMCVRLK